MYRDDLEALRVRLASVEAALEAERKVREAAEAETRAAQAKVAELRLALKRGGVRPASWIRRHGPVALCFLVGLVVALAWRTLDAPRRPAPAVDGDAVEDEGGERPGEKGYLVANTYPWARVYVDGRDTGLTTPISDATKLELSPGKHRITFVVKGERFPSTVVIKAGQTIRILRRLPVTAID